MQNTFRTFRETVIYIKKIKYHSDNFIILPENLSLDKMYSVSNVQTEFSRNILLNQM